MRVEGLHFAAHPGNSPMILSNRGWGWVGQAEAEARLSICDTCVCRLLCVQTIYSLTRDRYRRREL